MEQRALPRAARSHDRDEVPGGDLERYARERVHLGLTAAEDLVHVADRDHRAGVPDRGAPGRPRPLSRRRDAGGGVRRLPLLDVAAVVEVPGMEPGAEVLEPEPPDAPHAARPDPLEAEEAPPATEIARRPVGTHEPQVE